MGVGTYADDFYKTGGTIIVDGPLEGDQDDYNEFNRRLIETVESAGAALGLNEYERSGFRAERASFDDEFVGILRGKFHDVGWRSWEHDFVIGVGATKRSDWQDKIHDPEAWAMDVLLDTGRSPQAFAKLTSEFSENLQTFVRLCLQEEGFECSYKTSGYTSAQYEVPADLAQQKEALKQVLLGQIQELEKDAQEAFKAQSPQEREETIRAVSTSVGEHERSVYERNFSIEVPVYSHDSKSVLFIDPFKGEFIAATTAKDQATGIDLAEVMADAPAEGGLSAIPRDERTEAWFAHRTERGSPVRPDKFVLVATADEFAAGAGEDLVITYDSVGAAVERVLDLGDAMLSGRNVTDPAQVRKDCSNLLETIGDGPDEKSVAFRKGIEAVQTLLASNHTEQELGVLAKAIQAAHDVPDDGGVDVTLSKHKRPGTAPR